MYRKVFRHAVVPVFVLSATLAVAVGRAAGPLLIDDYRRAFGEDPFKIGAVAIMTDTDNTGEEAVAWYGAGRFLPPGP